MMVNSLWRAGDLVLVVSVHGSDSCSDAEWSEYLGMCGQAMAEHASDHNIGGLVVSEGGGPTARQREELRIALGIRKPRVAVITSSLVTRGIGTALSWFNPHLRTYPPRDWERALDHLHVQGAGREALLRHVYAQPAPFPAPTREIVCRSVADRASTRTA
jgi:hypothetical protein